jgi:peptide deformylase
LAILTILAWPDERLRDVAEPVARWDAALQTLVDDLFDTMYDDEGVGLAAIQVGIRQRVIVVDCGEDESNPIALINPTIERREGETIFAEGCLSVPGIRAEVNRSDTISVAYQDVMGQVQHLTASGLLSICIQHEIDHLDGKLYFDHLPEFERKSFLQAYETVRQGANQ